MHVIRGKSLNPPTQHVNGLAGRKRMVFERKGPLVGIQFCVERPQQLFHASAQRRRPDHVQRRSSLLFLSRREQHKRQPAEMIAVQVRDHRHLNGPGVDSLALQQIGGGDAALQKPGAGSVLDDDGALGPPSAEERVPGSKKGQAHVRTMRLASALNRPRISSAMICATVVSSYRVVSTSRTSRLASVRATANASSKWVPRRARVDSLSWRWSQYSRGCSFSPDVCDTRRWIRSSATEAGVRRKMYRSRNGTPEN